jgi:L-iditol 2-dehydrogenase
MIGRRIVFTGPGRVAVESFEVGRPAADQILIEAIYSSISPGTERAHLLAEPNTGTGKRGFPFHPGYSNIGRIVEVGAAVTAYQPGQLVATERPHLSHILMPGTVGPELPPEKYRSEFKSKISPDAAQLIHHLIWPLRGDLDRQTLRACSTFAVSKVGLHGVRRARIELGEAVLIVGLGPIGVSAAQYARLFGGLPVLGLDPSPARRKLALALGLDAVYADPSEMAAGHPLMAGVAPPVVIEATGRPEVIPVAFRLCAQNGRVVLLGSTRGATDQLNFYSDVHKKGLAIIGVHALTRPVHESTAGNWTDWDDTSVVLRLIANGRIDCAPLVTHEFGAEDAAHAYQAVCDSSDAMVVVLNWSA